MKYWVRTFIGLAICGAAIVAIDWALYHLVRTGTCASGGPYVSARPCPPGTGLHIVSLVGGIFGGLIGMGVYATRGGEGRSTASLGAIMWMLLFCTLAGSSLLAAFGPANNDDSGAKTAAVVLGLTFIPMGLGPLPFALMGKRKGQRAMELVQSGKRCRGVVESVDDTGVTINDNPRVRITVRAEPPGEPPFKIVKTSVVPRVNIPRPGDSCTVFYDPARREEKNGITFDPVPGFSPEPKPPPSPVASFGAMPEEEDPIKKIEELGKLRDKGLITPEEFEAQKQRLLGEI